MGFFRRLFGQSSSDPESMDQSAPQSPVRVTVEVGMELKDEVHLTGTTTIAKPEATALAARLGVERGGHATLVGTLPRDLAVDRSTPVLVDGQRVGFVQRGLKSSLHVTKGGRSIPVQIFTDLQPEGLRVEAWAWLGEGKPEWTWSADKRPPLSSQTKAQAAHDDRVQMVRDALAGGGQRAADFRRGMVNGTHYLELVEPIKQLKREGRLEEALDLCLQAITAAENARDGREPAPWYTEQAAIVYRKLGQTETLEVPPSSPASEPDRNAAISYC